ncbi:MAG: hypothetical protein ACR2HD_05915 [Solirubrobacteraceae bacterium]|nr:MAG: hypothetical protein DLM63_09870 [Solirubrobacterales bacterium]
MTSFGFLRALSFTNSTVFTGLLAVWAAGSAEPATFILGLSHGLMWISLSCLSLLAVRRRTIPFWLAVLVAVIGGLGPYVGSAGFVLARRHGWGAPPSAGDPAPPRPSALAG